MDETAMARENRRLRQELIALRARLADNWDPLRDSDLVKQGVRVAILRGIAEAGRPSKPGAAEAA